jgi:hypothetical protein
MHSGPTPTIAAVHYSLTDPDEHDLGVDRALHVFFNNVLISFGVLFELQFFEKLGFIVGVVEHGCLESPT